jgi:hypothetical protein
VAIKNEQGRVLIEFDVTLGVVGALLAPQLAAIGASAALASRSRLASTICRHSPSAVYSP